MYVCVQKSEIVNFSYLIFLGVWPVGEFIL